MKKGTRITKFHRVRGHGFCGPSGRLHTQGGLYKDRLILFCINRRQEALRDGSVDKVFAIQKELEELDPSTHI